MIHSLQLISLSSIVQIVILAILYYFIFLFFRGTRGAQVLIGFVLLLAVLIGFTRVFGLSELNWLLSRTSFIFGIALLVIFQPEIRRALAELGKQSIFAANREKHNIVDHVVQAVILLANQRIGALIAIEREIGTRAIQETGTKLDAPVVAELISSIFFPHTPLHDGGLIISGNRMAAASCVFPLSQNEDLHRKLGTRHRAAVGLSEETDAVVVIVSEESANISVSYRGRLSQGLDEDRLRRFLSALLVKRGDPDNMWSRLREKLDLNPGEIAKSEMQIAKE